MKKQMILLIALIATVFTLNANSFNPVIVSIEKGAGGLDKKSVVQCDQIKSLDKSRIVGKRGRFSRDIMINIDAALKISLALT